MKSFIRIRVIAPALAMVNAMAMIAVTIAIALAAEGHGASAGAMGPSAAEYLRPVVTQRQFTDLIRPLELRREQRMIVELVFEDYREAVERAINEADREADAKGRRLVADALAGRRMVPTGELRHYRVEVLKVYRSLPSRAQELAERLVTDVRSVLTAEQRPKLDEQMYSFRREFFLHPRHLGRGDYEYAGEGIDVLLLMEDARGESGELAAVPMNELRLILAAYEKELDAHLRENAAAHHEVSIDARIARIARDQQAAREAERRSLQQWRSLYELNRRTVERIGELAAGHVGDQAQRQWRRRFDREMFGWMFAPTRPDRIVAWMANHPLDDDRLQEAEAVLEAYHDDRWPLLRDAADIMIRAREEFQTVVYSMMDPSDLDGRARLLYRELLLNSGHVTSLESRTVAALESLLDDEERGRMRREVIGR